MGTLVDLAARVATLLSEGAGLALAELRFWHADEARLALAAAAALGLALVILRSTLLLRSARQRVALPAVFAALQPRSWSFLRHAPMVLVAAGVPWIIMAVADPYSTLTQRQETFPGRRICIMLDASSSMVRPFNAPLLRQTSGVTTQATFFTTVAAAERFVQLRTQGKYRDLMSLVEFGDKAYVVTPFTTDYDNILLSLSLVGDFTEFIRFPDQGTVLSNAVEQGVSLFRAFEFLEASGNLMVLFSDGEDSEVIAGDRNVSEIVRDAVDAKVPIYFVRTRFDRGFGSVVSDAQWKEAVERTGGRFYAASNESSLIQAIQDIDRVAAGRIDVKQYVSQRPKYRPFALVAAGLWSVAIVLALTVPAFRSFPA
ncbi:MAG: vWA domain-containing protein [Vicinamibacterales bacterium]